MNKINELILKYRKIRLELMKDRREYETEYAHNWVINLCKDIEKDLKDALGEGSEVKNEI